MLHIGLYRKVLPPPLCQVKNRCTGVAIMLCHVTLFCWIIKSVLPAQFVTFVLRFSKFSNDHQYTTKVITYLSVYSNMFHHRESQMNCCRQRYMNTSIQEQTEQACNDKQEHKNLTLDCCAKCSKTTSQVICFSYKLEGKIGDCLCR